MAMRCWDVHDQIANAYVVFASSQDDAVRLGNKDLASYGGYESPDMTAIERLPASAGRSAHHLLAAIARNEEGIGHRQTCGGWMILPPGIRPKRSLGPSFTTMHYFNDDEDYQVVLFAHDEDRASALYEAISSNDHQDLPDEWLGSEWDAWTTVGLVRHQRHAERRGVEGFGVYGRDGWQIFPLDYAALGIDPPDG